MPNRMALSLPAHEQKLKARLLSRIVIDANDCWLYQRGKTTAGYGHISTGSTGTAYAHRLSWELHAGKIPDGLCVLHKCDVRHCVNPTHLFLGTVADNNLDMVTKGRDAKRSCLTAEQRQEIRSDTGVRARVVAKYTAAFKVSPKTVRNVLNDKTWRREVKL